MNTLTGRAGNKRYDKNDDTLNDINDYTLNDDNDDTLKEIMIIL